MCSEVHSLKHGPPPLIARLMGAWGPASYETLCAMGQQALAEEVWGWLTEQWDERNARLAKAADQEDEDQNGDRNAQV